MLHKLFAYNKMISSTNLGTAPVDKVLVDCFYDIPFGTIRFISEDFAVMSCASRESLLKYIWHPSVLSTEIVGTVPVT